MNITSSIEHVNCQVGCRVHSRYYIILYLSAEYTPPMNITSSIEQHPEIMIPNSSAHIIYHNTVGGRRSASACWIHPVSAQWKHSNKETRRRLLPKDCIDVIILVVIDDPWRVGRERAATDAIIMVN